MARTVIPYDKALPEIEGRTPYSRPDKYLKKLGEGKYTIEEGRRPSTMLLVDKLRETVDRWREQENYDGASEVSKRLMNYWFEEDHLLPNSKPFNFYFSQQESMETLIYLVEVKGFKDIVPIIQKYAETFQKDLFEQSVIIETAIDGSRKVRRYIPEIEKETIQDLPEEKLLRFAFKMATGSGKTIVMAMAIVWSYFHRKMLKGSNCADNFLIVAPNVIVFERLEKDFASNKIFYELPLIPPEWKSQWNVKPILRGDSSMPERSGNLFLTNIQQIYESAEEEAEVINPVDAILGKKPKLDLASQGLSMLERIKRLDNLMVLNDEAHHVHDEDLAWNQTLLSIHDGLKIKTGKGLSLWLDFSATPKTQAGTYFPWIVVDYPLAQAIEDKVVKAPLIVHQVEKKDPDYVTADSVVEAYNDWLIVALTRWREHYGIFNDLGEKPVLFIMAERTTYADKIADRIREESDLKADEVLVIHTDTQGVITKKDLDIARDAAKNIDTNQIKVIVSVLMLREGWDVKNVSVILGLRPFTSKARILPEQAVGRGLRLMERVSPDSLQTLEVIGTDAFEEFVRELEQEGVGIDTVGPKPPPPVKIYPVLEKMEYDIHIPLTKPKYTHEYKELDRIDPLSLPPIYKADVLDERLAIDIEMTFATTDTSVHRARIEPGKTLIPGDILGVITNKIIKKINLPGYFNKIIPIIKKYVTQRCFGKQVDLENQEVKRRLRDPMLQEGIAAFLASKIADLSTRERPIEFEQPDFHLSETSPFTWRRKHAECEKTIFNLVVAYSDLEVRFAQFLNSCMDIEKFAKLAEWFTRFRVDYLGVNGAIKFYYPDFVAVQTTDKAERIHWIIETKGRELGDVAHKDKSMKAWCEKITEQTGIKWHYLKVQQAVFDSEVFHTYDQLVKTIKGMKDLGLFKSD